jgi:nucleotide-binding universal stress UspA family protein
MALNIAVRRAEAFGDSVVYLVHSLSQSVGEDVDRIEQLEVFLNKACEELSERGIVCEPHLLIRGLQPGEDIVQFAKDIHADEILIGVEKRSRMEKMLLGSTAQYVVLNSPCPVTTVRREA